MFFNSAGQDLGINHSQQRLVCIISRLENMKKLILDFLTLKKLKIIPQILLRHYFTLNTLYVCIWLSTFDLHICNILYCILCSTYVEILM